MRVALCDDDRRLLEELKPFVYQYANARKFDMAVDTFNSGEALLASRTVYDMIYLDYQMGGMDGLSAARELRERNLNSTIIFMTNYPDFVYESFEVNPFRFFKKPVDRDHVFTAMDAYFKMFGNDYPISLRYDGATVLLNTQEVVYVEAMGKRCIVHQPKEYKEIGSTMGSIVDMLPKVHFFKVHNSFVINFNYVAKYDGDFVTMKTGAKVPISKRCAKPFREAFKTYAEQCNPRRPERRV
jgi:DNA-binding LytR/AlgR family response regulator